MAPKRCLLTLTLLALAVLLPFTGHTAEQPAKLSLPADYFKALSWRSIGPANMGGRIVAVAVAESDPSTWWAATASGGLIKTTNNGITFEHQFDREATVSIGDIAVAPSNKDIVWVGTGEHNPRNSVSYGDGVYKSLDGGKTWKNMGLKKSFQIGRIVIHPKDPDIVHVGALGRLYGPNEERGLFRTTDGGKTWKQVLYVDDKTGVIELKMSPGDPESLLAATYERQRDGYDLNDPIKKWGEGSGLHRSTDGGKTWTKITKGLPTSKLGRIGLDFSRKDPRTVFAIIESEKIGLGPPPAAGIAYMGITGQDRQAGAELMSVNVGGPADRAGLKPGDIIVGIDDKPVRSYRDLTEIIRGHKGGEKVKVTRKRENDTKVIEVTLGTRGGPGAPPGSGADRPYGSNLGGQRENAQNEQGKDGFQYGGVYKSTDAGETWTRINSLNPRPMYFSQVRVDPSDDSNIYVLGIALYRSNNGGETFRSDAGKGAHADHHALWIDPRDGRHMILGNDGGVYVSYDRANHWDHLNTTAIGQFYHVAVDSRPLYRAYGGLQDNGTWGGPTRTRSNPGPINEDWIHIAGGDGFGCRVDPNDPDLLYFTAQWGNLGRRNLRTRDMVRFKPQAPRGSPEYRFNWNTPFVVSAHDSRIFYTAGNLIFKSTDRGRDLRPISTDITATPKGSATALAESPKNAQLLYAGTDDGYVWVTRDGGKNWSNVTKNVGLPGLRHVSSIEASRYVEGRVFVVFDAHRSDDDKPYVYVSEDYGETWKPLHGDLPKWGTTRVLREDIENPNLLYLGTEFFVFCSLDRGQTWVKLNNNLPTVAIHEIAQHPTGGEIVAATHGRSLWVLDVTALRQLTAATQSEAATLLRPATTVRWLPDPSRGRTNRRFVGDNPEPGASLYFILTKKADKVGLKIIDGSGKRVRELDAPKTPGLHRVLWDMTSPVAEKPMPGEPPRGNPVAAGTYKVVLTVDGVELTQFLKIENDPAGPPRSD
jgi:photosystem II stability/assembly factor-like uncharacterized protein